MVPFFIKEFFRRLVFNRLPETKRIRMWPELRSVGGNVRLTGFPNFGSEPFLIEIGSDVTISANVAFVNHDGGVRIFRDLDTGLHVYDRIKIGDRVFIGMGTILLPGVEIGNDCVVGAGSVVTKNIPEGTVAAGVPCMPLKSTREYRESSLEKAFLWRTGDYGPAWRKALETSIYRLDEPGTL